MRFAVAAPWWVLPAGVALAGLIAWGAYRRPGVPLSFWRRVALVDLRAAALVLVFLFLLQPVRSAPGPAGAPVVAVLVDHSRSMAIADAGGRTRLAQAVALVRERLVPQLAPHADVRLFSFGDALFETTLDAAPAHADRSDLAGALDELPARLDGRPVAGVVVLSDGGMTGPRTAAAAAAESGLRLFTVGVGAAEPGPDRELVSLTAGDPTAAESVVDLTAVVVTHGADGAPFDVTLSADGQPVDERRVSPSAAGAPVRVVFRVRPAADAATLYTVEAPPVAGELVAGNNRRRVLVPPAPRPRRLLVVEGAPTHELAFLKRVWQADPGLDLDAVVRKGMNDLGEQTFYVQGEPERTAALGEGYPRSREALFGYDALLLANVEADFFQSGQLEMTADFVADRGGGLLVLGDATLARRGLGASALAPLLPVALVDPGRAGGYGAPGRGAAAGAGVGNEAPVAPGNDAGGGGEAGASDGGAGGNGSEASRSEALTLTAEGAAHPVMRLGATADETRERWGALPPLAGVVAVGAPKPGADVLAVAPAAPGRPAQPLIAAQRYGAGRTMVFAGRAAWRWRMRMPADDRTYEVFWRQVARWLAGSARDPVTLTTRGGAAPGDGLEIDLQVRDAEHVPVADAAPVVTVTGPDGEPRRLRPELVDGAAGRYRARLRTAAAGVHRIDAAAERDGEPLGAARHWVLVGAADPELADPWLNAPALERAAAASGGRHAAPDGVDGLAASILDETTTPPAAALVPLWHNVWTFLWLTAVLAAEWGLRRRWGLR